ncbi:MAG TPA: hypothetical protein PKW54_08105 [Ferruginibacter sp.]|nr:hypothetical protein [Ferruginibacter sp.]
MKKLICMAIFMVPVVNIFAQDKEYQLNDIPLLIFKANEKPVSFRVLRCIDTNCERKEEALETISFSGDSIFMGSKHRFKYKFDSYDLVDSNQTRIMFHIQDEKSVADLFVVFIFRNERIVNFFAGEAKDFSGKNDILYTLPAIKPVFN